jgi:hypothetical protein
MVKRGGFQGEEKDRVIDLCGIYNEMNEEGKKQMVSVVEGYLSIQKSQIPKVSLSDNLETKEFLV